MVKNHEKYMSEALKHARQALNNKEFPVGCVFVAGGEIIAQGKRINTTSSDRNEIDHAEKVALRSFLQDTRGINPVDITVYSTMEPCLMCYSTMLLSGLRSFVWAYEDVMGGGTNLPLDKLNPLYAEMKVNCTANILRNESLSLFQDFFKNHTYWQNSLLSRYTLEQIID